MNQSKKVSIHFAKQSDKHFILKARNIPSTRNSSFVARKLAPAEHSRWFRRIRTDKKTLLWVIKADKHSIGTIRLNTIQKSGAEIHINLLPEWRGHGYAKLAIAEALQETFAPKIYAHIKADNVRSIYFFRSLGFSKISGRPVCQGEHKCVTLMWVRKNILFFLEAGSILGMGHLMRELTLSEKLALSGFCTTFFVSAPKQNQKKIKELVNSYSKISPSLIFTSSNLSQWIKKNKPKVLIIDTVNLPNRTLIQKIKRIGCKIVLIGNYLSVPEWTDAVVNSYTKPTCKSSKTRLFTSSQYTILSDSFLQNGSYLVRNKRATNLFILPGGGNTEGMVFKIAHALKNFQKDFTINLVLGNFFTEKQKLLTFLKKLKCKVKVWSSLPPSGVASLMKQADLAILSYGRSLDEARRLGLPAILLSSNDINKLGSIEAEKKGGAIYLGDIRELDENAIELKLRRIINDSNLRQDLSKKGRLLVDGNGTERVARIIGNLL